MRLAKQIGTVKIERLEPRRLMSSMPLATPGHCMVGIMSVWQASLTPAPPVSTASGRARMHATKPVIHAHRQVHPLARHHVVHAKPRRIHPATHAPSVVPVQAAISSPMPSGGAASIPTPPVPQLGPALAPAASGAKDVSMNPEMLTMSERAVYENYALTITADDGSKTVIPIPSTEGFSVEQNANNPLVLLINKGVATLQSTNGANSVVLATDAAQNPGLGHSGDFRQIARRGNVAWVAWMGSTPVGSGTPIYLAQVDLASWTVTKTMFMGFAGPTANGTTGGDEHDLPQIVLDQSGYLYVVLGAHNGPIYWTKSINPLTILTSSPGVSPFLPLKNVGPTPDNPSWGQTYPDLAIHPDGTLDVVSRSTAYAYHFQLLHWTISPNGQTGPVTIIDQASPGCPYAIWYQRLYRAADGTLTVTAQRFEQTPGQPLTAMNLQRKTYLSTDGGLTWAGV